MKALIWLVVLFAGAAAVAVLTHSYPGNVFIIVGDELRRVSLNTFILSTVVFAGALDFHPRWHAPLWQTPSQRQSGRRFE